MYPVFSTVSRTKKVLNKSWKDKCVDTLKETEISERHGPCPGRGYHLASRRGEDLRIQITWKKSHK